MDRKAGLCTPATDWSKFNSSILCLSYPKVRIRSLGDSALPAAKGAQISCTYNDRYYERNA